jgi:hypothetical protein
VQNLQNKLFEYYHQYKSYWPVVVGALLVFIIFVTGASIVTNLNKTRRPTPQNTPLAAVQNVQPTNIPESQVKSKKEAEPKTSNQQKEKVANSQVPNAKILPKTGFPLIESVILLFSLAGLGLTLFFSRLDLKNKTKS